MTEQEIALRKQIDFNNKWPDASLQLQSTKCFEKRLNDMEEHQILVPIQLDKENAIKLFEQNKDIAKIFSTTLDVFDVLPMHPDIAFDVSWRALEISLKYMSIKSWRYGVAKSFEDVLEKGCTDIMAPYCKEYWDIEQLFDKLLKKTSSSSLRYLVSRLFFKMDLSVSPQVKYVRQRAERLLGEEIIQAIHDKYVDEKGNLDANNQRNAARLFLLILKGEDINVNGTVLKGLDISTRIELYTSCVVYSSRCERFHGDHYSPLKSNLAKLTTYHEYYYLLIFSYALWGIVMHKIQSVVKGPETFTIKSICKNIGDTLDKMDKIFPKD